MKVVLLTTRDYANLSYTLEQCLKEVGYNAVALKTANHKFKYPNEAKIAEKGEMRKEVKSADIVIFMHSEFIGVKENLDNKIVAVIHTGSRYREEHKEINKFFNPIADVTFSGSDVLNFGAKNEYWIQPPIDTKNLFPVYDRIIPGKLVVAHYPSAYKGIDIIQDAFKLVKSKNIEFRYDKKNVLWLENIKRMKRCDVYIGEMNLVQPCSSTKLTTYGISALEAACLGKIICHRFFHKDDYYKEFGECAIHAVNDARELAEKLDYIAGLNPNEILALKEKSREWVERVHSYKSVGNRMKTIFEGIKK